MVDVAAVRSWVESSRYSSLLDYVKNELSFNVGDEPVSEILYKHDVNKLVLAGMSIQELSEAASRNVDFCKYLAAKVSIIKGTENEQEGGGQDDKVLNELPFYRNFLNLYLIEFYVLSNRPGFLDVYLKSIRIPNSRKYSVQLKKAFAFNS